MYDRARPSDAAHLEWWFEKIAEKGGLGPGRRLLDLGCGTGRWTLPLVQRTGCHAVGVDNSPEMLERARSKDRESRVTWVLGDVERLEVEPESFDCALMSLMMHHLENHLAAFHGVFRALRSGGVFLIRQGTLEQIQDDVVHRLFPEALSVDRKRTPFRVEIERWLRRAGFEKIEIDEVRQITHLSNDELLKDLRLRVCSVLRLISDKEFEEGLRRTEEYIRRSPDDPCLRQDLFSLFSASKPALMSSAQP